MSGHGRPVIVKPDGGVIAIDEKKPLKQIFLPLNHMAVFAALDDFQSRYGLRIQIRCGECGGMLSGMNFEGTAHFAVVCECREFLARNPRPSARYVN